ncbi:EamA family transporter [Salinarimonas ramus]|uniref:Membrane protein n=1 Tax=Salinarimonas ramus TaxID=690164 RepID=A0A917V4K9_9HYPH|nr:EamA family transporter [Salinarimonas ramus]GGK35929.1 membrane protein [Salinarimonas ramus]
MAGTRVKARAAPTSGRTFAIGLGSAVAAMIVLQIGAALSTPVMKVHGALEITWLRLAFAAVLIWIVARPKIRTYSALQWRTALALGAAMALVNVGFYQSLVTIPIGVAVAIEFLGPLTVAALYLIRTDPRAVIWPICAAAGVLCLTVGPLGDFPSAAGPTAEQAIGMAWAASAAIGWGAYVVFMRRTGHAFAGLDGLAMSLAAATLITTPFALATSDGPPSTDALFAGLCLAVLVPLIPYALEMAALKRMHVREFGVCTSAEPVIAVLVGWFVLGQILGPMQLVGVVLVTLAMTRVMQLRRLE